MRMLHPKCVSIALTLWLTCSCMAQTPAPATTDKPPAAVDKPADPAPAAPVWSVGPIDFSGIVDGYYSLNFNHPASRNNTGRNFDAKSDSFSLNMVKFTAEHTADPVGFKLELGFGRAFEIFNAAEPGGLGIFRNILQAYASVKPAKGNGFQVDFGKFNTSAGAEVTETHLNWNYSRSLLFANGPYYHFGVRTTMPVGKHFVGGVQVINGWNNVEDNNSSKTIGLTAAITTAKFNWFNNYYVGNEKTDTAGGVKIKAPGVRNFWDTVVNYNPNSKFNALFNFDYGQDNSAITIAPGKTSAAKFYGYSAAARFMPAGNDTFCISPRYDWYKDRDGFITLQSQTLQEFTLTGDYKMKEGLLARLEFRRDWSDQPFFDRGSGVANYKSMTTLLLGVVAYFGPKR
jgi:hypothetical protein